jgi:hypothetical protein
MITKACSAMILSASSFMEVALGEIIGLADRTSIL